MQKMGGAHDHRDGTDPFTYGRNKRITSSLAYRIQVQREDWLGNCLLLSRGPDSVVGSRKPWDSALITAVLLLSCGASLGSCFHLVSTISPEDVTTWKSSLHVGYLIAPFCTTAAGLGAMYLHGHWCTSGLDSGQIICGVITSTSRLLYFVLPASILTAWSTSSGQNIVTINEPQIALLVAIVILPKYALQTGSDDW
jgi:hypothetical protein